MEATYVGSYGLLFALVIVGYPIVAAIVLALDIESRAATVPYRAVVIVVGLLVAYLATIYHWGRWYTGRAWIFFGLFLVFYVLRLLLDTVINEPLLRLPPEEYWLQFFAVCILPMIPFFVAPSIQVLKTGFQSVLFAGIIAGILVAIFALPGDGIDLATLAGGRIGSDVFSPIYVGHLGVTLILLSVAQLVRHTIRGRYWRASSGAAAIVGIALLAMSGSRGPIAALLLSLGALCVAYRRERAGLAALASLTILVATTLLVVYAEQEFGFNALDRLSMTFNQSFDESILERQNIMANAIEQFFESPLLGSGIEEQIYFFYPHNVFVEGFMATGVFGGTAFATLLLMTAWAAYRAFRSDAIWIALIYFQQLVFGQSSGGLYFANVMWATMASVLALSMTRRSRWE